MNHPLRVQLREIISRLRLRREQLSMTQGELAELLGVSRISVNNWEVGRSYPSIYNLYAWGYTLGFDVTLTVQHQLEETTS